MLCLGGHLIKPRQYIVGCKLWLMVRAMFGSLKVLEEDSESGLTLSREISNNKG